MPTDRRVVRALRVEKDVAREFMAEFLGTGVLTVFLVGAAMQFTLNKETSPAAVYLTAGVGISMAFYICGGVSGGCFNPAVSLSVCIMKRRPFRVLPFHWAGQLSGAFVATALVYSVYTGALDDYDGGKREMFGPNGTAFIFCSFTRDYLSIKQGFADVMLSTGVLIVCALAITDKRNMALSPAMYPIPIGLIVFALVATFERNCGCPINGCKDLAARTFILIAGWGTEPFSYRDYQWWWVPVLAPLCGATVACLLYWLLIENHWPEDSTDALELEANGSDTTLPVHSTDLQEGSSKMSPMQLVPSETRRG